MVHTQGVTTNKLDNMFNFSYYPVMQMKSRKIRYKIDYGYYLELQNLKK